MFAGFAFDARGRRVGVCLRDLSVSVSVTDDRPTWCVLLGVVVDLRLRSTPDAIAGDWLFRVWNKEVRAAGQTRRQYDTVSDSRAPEAVLVCSVGCNSFCVSGH